MMKPDLYCVFWWDVPNGGWTVPIEFDDADEAEAQRKAWSDEGKLAMTVAI